MEPIYSIALKEAVFWTHIYPLGQAPASNTTQEIA